jgi:hypothetical protein
MKKYHIIFNGLCLLLSSCAVPVTYFGDKLTQTTAADVDYPAHDVTYFGDKLTPTTAVDVYYSAHDVAKQYKVIGHLAYLYANSQDVIKAKLITYAQKIGADAIVIKGSTIDTNGTFSGGSDVVNADALKYTK